MISYDGFPINDEIKATLLKHRVDFVFQPIFNKNREIAAYEALMRPEGRYVLDYIEEMRQTGRLHELELVSFFGATAAYRQRNYCKKLCINSFPSECFTAVEAKNYSDCFRPIKDKLVIEILEYTENDPWKWEVKKAHSRIFDDVEFSLDDFGTGFNDSTAVDFYRPQTVKLDRSLIHRIDASPEKQHQAAAYVDRFHRQGILVLAEGIETQAEFTYLATCGVDLFQGFYLAKPE